MKACVVLAVLLSVAFSESGNSVPQEDDGIGMEYFLVETEPGVYEVEDLVHAEIDVRASPSDLTYHFHSRSNPSRGIDIRTTNIGALRNTQFSVAKDTLFIVHGWRNSHESAVNNYIRESILARHDINVFVVDWSPVAGRNYVSAQGAVTTVGNHVADFIRALIATFGLRLDRVAFVGHSLGAHVSGNAGASLNGQVDHIVGLDPALPLFSINNINNRLDPSDARFVQVIHTNGGLLGFRDSIGDSDFFPNGGSSQPGCGVDLAGTCAHSRAYAYYAEAIRASRNLFVSALCGNMNDFNAGRCNSNTRSAMGGYTIDRIRGDFYLTTNSQSPFARG
ncbi:pancreatic triacylglycerol lipase [Anoplophora glabripennis]|uniref:pancreatic triacylglycerol lipase n=1 Tax=Anoplophora glabripennis TaxID=217634 RepID=UPI0008738BD9|nr:pancreatic triacylglycerol lipase [Anoplophora glabripennis]